MKRDAEVIYAHLKSDREAPRPKKLTVALAKGLLPDATRGATSPLGGQAKPEPKRPNCKW